MGLFYKNKLVWIVGGSRGIGLALARDLVKRGAKVIISARHQPIFSDNPKEKFPYEFYSLDVMNEAALKIACSKMQHVDGLIITSGIYHPNVVAKMDEQHLDGLIKVNILAPSMFASYMGKVLEKKRGFFAVCGSLAGENGLPAGQPYAGSKNYIKNFMESMAVEFEKLYVHLIEPGFVKTDLIKMNKFSMPMIMSAPRAAAIILHGIAVRRFRIRFPYSMLLFSRIFAIQPIKLQRFWWRKFKSYII